jgi:Carboxypeptidase regulatory-like domain
MSILKRTVIALVAAFVLPQAAMGQAIITGTVRDTSGAVLPGVSVEASSPALIEKVRTTVTDGSGQYRIIDLRPGVYAVTFSLQGFSTVKRDGIELAGSFTANVNAELRVGSLEETITVTGESPTVDVQATTRQRVLDEEIISTLPTGRNQFNLGVLIPGMGVSGAPDIGGSVGFDAATVLTIHGSKNDNQRLTQNGVVMNAPVAGGYGGGNDPNPTATQEFTIDYSGISAEAAEGGVRINFLPKDGGNDFRGTVFASFANDNLQSDNVTPELLARGLKYGNPIDRNWDVNPGFGGPIRPDKLWFYGSYRNNGAWNFVPGMFYNKNTNNPDAWTYEPDPSQPISRQHSYYSTTARLTLQATQQNKLAFSYQGQIYCQCANGVSATVAPEAGYERRWPMMNNFVMEWTAPVTNRLLLEAVGLHSEQRWAHNEMWITKQMFGQEGIDSRMISVTDTGGAIPGLMYRARDSYLHGGNSFTNTRAALSYVTGASALKTGFNINTGHNGPNYTYSLQPISYRFNNGVPNQLTQRADDFTVLSEYTEFGAFIQEKLTMRKLTLNLGARYDHYRNLFPAQTIGPTVLDPSRNLSFPETPNLRWHDLTPRLGASYDLFGTGKTAVKVTLGKYLQGMPNGVAESVNPISTLVTNTTRGWLDADRDYVADCDLTNPAVNGECQAIANANFGKPISAASADPNLLRGWGLRNYNWEFSTGVQHEVLPRVSVDIGYFRRWFGNFQVVDNLAVMPADFQEFSIVAPVDPRLPDGGGYTVPGLYDIRPEAFGRPGSYLIQLSDNFGSQIEHWNGFDFNASARLPNSVMVQGGVSTGRTTMDDCDVVKTIGRTSFGSALSGFNASPSDGPSPLYCHVDTAFQTQVKLIGSYTVPRIDVQIAGTFQSRPGPQLAANYNAPLSVYGPSLGRIISGGNVNSTVAVNLIEPGTMFGERLNVLDLRFNKVLRMGATRMLVGVDLYNAMNTSAVLSQNNNYAAWQVPTAIVTPRFAKFNVTFDF